MSTRVYVGGLSHRAREKDIERFFRKFGRIREISLKVSLLIFCLLLIIQRGFYFFRMDFVLWISTIIVTQMMRFTK